MKSQQGAGIKMDTDGYMLAPAKPILPGVPVDDAVALIDRFVNQKNGG